MNYLAHLFLAGENEDLIIGNFIADHIKGNKIEDYKPGIKRGILMHRSIDDYTDSHEIVRRSIHRLRPSYSKYSGVIVDMFYDHFLATEWNKYSKESIENFTKSRYDLLFRNFQILPPRAQRILPHMARNNWLSAYAEFEGLQKALTGMSHRTTFVSKMEHAVTDLKISYKEYKTEFEEFFPELCNFVAEKHGV
ncbi:MAG: DUF479 domain-containing protein [Bacteroidetes bacterium]|nr:DUF479 domain-containing protein [Bacteroidota bacterium]